MGERLDSSKSTDPLAAARPAAERLWLRLGEMFGTRFAESYGPQPPRSWVEAVGDLRYDQIAGALVRIRNANLAHPPTLPEFIGYAKNIVQAATGERVQARLVAYAVKHCRLTERQLAAPWAWLYRGDASSRNAEPFAIAGVVIPADGDAPRHRILVDDLALEGAA